jgi:hypothetical protein
MPDTSTDTHACAAGLAEAREHIRAAHATLRKSVEGFIPAGFREHRRAARKEMLLAMRSLIDAALERAESRKGL